VVNKPADMLSVPGRGEDNQDCLTTRIQHIYPDALSVHRLDMATSGLMVMARNKEVHRLLSMAFAERKVSKRYIAQVAGTPEATSGMIDFPLIADWPNRPRQKICYEQGKPSLTHWRLLESMSDKSASFLELEPVTGRSHQLRLHLAGIGHPILGDEFYAPEEHVTPYARMMLHACFLEFMHPVTALPVQFVAVADFYKH
ncbi:MAG: pseudouridine synthase, partial [Saezia sp.]